MNKYLFRWEKQTQELADEFIRKYFLSDDVTSYEVESYWVGDEIGDVFCVGDYFINLDTITDSLRYNATFEQFDGYYQLCLDKAMEGEPPGINYKNWIKQGLTNE